MSNPMAVSLSTYTTARNNFTQHYYLDQCNPNFGGQDIQISWDSLSGVVNDFVNSNDIAAKIALLFVYCYDANPDVNAMYLRMQICTMTADPNSQNTYNLVSTPCAWYAITDGNIATTTDTNPYDQAYLDNFYYCDAAVCSESSLVKLASDTGATIYARTVVFPWSEEILQMYTDNGSPEGASISFAACAFEAGATTACGYPHTLVLYLTDAKGNMLVDDSKVTGFQMKAADMGTLCPTMCGVYVGPSA